MRTGTLIAGLALATGCDVADASFFESLADGAVTGTDAGFPGDGGVVPTDGGQVDAGTPSVGVADRCGAADTQVIAETKSDIVIDTTELSNAVGSLPSCGSTTAGSDGFLAVDVQPGEYWHFHLRVDPTLDPDPLSRNPILYLLNSSCAPTMCAPELLSNFCQQQQDEHFAFTFNEGGRWYIGIDDTNPGGGVYLLDAVKPSCGDGQPEHGEACDGQPGCSPDCLWIVDSENVRERGFNFNFDEANLVQVPPSTKQLLVSGDIGGFDGCDYPDVYAFNATAGTDFMLENETCLSGEPARLTFRLNNAAGSTLDEGTADAMGCQFIDRPSLPAGRFFLTVQDARPVDERSRPLSYELLFTVDD